MEKLFNFSLAGVLFGALAFSSCTNDDFKPEFNLTLNVDTLKLKVGETATLLSENMPEGASYVWSIDNENVASLKNGYVTALNAGQTTIYLNAKRGVATGNSKCVVVVSALNKEDAIIFKDVNLKTLILATNPELDANKDGEISGIEAEKLTSLNLELEDKGSAPANRILNRLDGIENFVNLEELNLRNHNVTNVDLVSKLTKLKTLNLGNNGINKINLSSLTELTDLRLYSNPDLKELDLSNNNKLETLLLQGTSITSLDLSNKVQLVNVAANNCKLTSLSCSNLPKLERIEVHRNNLASLTIENCESLQQIHANSNLITTIKLNGLPELNRLNLYDNRLASFSGSFPKLMFLYLYDNVLTNVDLSKLPLLLQCFIGQNPLETLDFSQNPILRDLDATEMQNLTTINLKNGGYNEEADYAIINGNTALNKIIVDAGDEEKHIQNLVKNNSSISVVTD